MRATLLLSSLYLLLPSLCLLIAGCGFPGGAPAREDPAPDGGAGRDGAERGDAGAIALDPTPGHYRGACDGSGVVGLDLAHFLAFGDEDQVARVYARGAAGGPVQSFALGAALGVGASAEVDLEDAARVGDRVYAISSHGRKSDGSLDPDRYRFVAIDLAGAPPSLQLTVAASRTRLLTDMLDASRWTAPSPAILSALQAASRLDQQKVPSLAPKDQGLNIEGLARAPAEGAPDRLVIGLRNPRPAGGALAISLLNPAAVAAGGAAQLGEATVLDLGGLGIRGMVWSDEARAVFLLAGPHDDADGPFRLYRWSGAPSAGPVLVSELSAPAGAHPEAIATYPGTADLQIAFDAGGVLTGGVSCKNGPAAGREFSDLIVHTR